MEFNYPFSGAYKLYHMSTTMQKNDLGTEDLCDNIGLAGVFATVRVKKNLPYRRYERPFIWCVVTKERSSNGPPTLNAVVRSGSRYRLNAHVLKLTTHVF